MTDLEKKAEDEKRMLSFQAGVEEMVKTAGLDPEQLCKEAGVKDMKELSGCILDHTAAMAETEQQDAE